ncbi:MAG: uroporphyrinogen decarboxylase family protein [Fusicatenibacter sp.]|nr:uroporphyrinogen decarboxylase family protein [Lachnospiraceae bacterium]MDY2938869.1 uroporphyrinogen decarboxylase family protein [Fusicatenibacter sp.]
MTFRENVLAILHYQKYDHFPVVSFGYWNETLEKWAEEGHITKEEAEGYAREGDNSPADNSVMKRLGFDFNWNSCPGTSNLLFPEFEKTMLEEKADGSRIVRDEQGLIVLEKPGVVSIPSEIGTSLTDRKAWEELYLPKLQWNPKRVDTEYFRSLPSPEDRQIPIGLHCGSLIGNVRNMLGVEQLSYLYVDDEDLYVEIIDTVANLAYQCVETVLESGARFDYAHFWEDICCKNGPLVTPQVFEDYVAPHYKKITSLLKEHGIDIVSVDCDGWIDRLVPIWLQNGVNTMFPIEVGTWNASIAPWRMQYGKELRGVGGMNKTVFSRDYKAIDEEIERLKPLIELGGYIPCPDHRIAPDAKFENVQYYCDKLQNLRI